MSEVVVDARGLLCPWPALRLARAMRESSDVTIVADDPAAPGEIAALAAARGWRLDILPGCDPPRFRVSA